MEIWKQFLGNLIRFACIYVFGVLTARNIISNELAQQLSESAVYFIVSFLFLIAPLVWQWAKVRWNFHFADELFQADPSKTSKRELKKKVIKNNKFVSPI
jgi:hypothetical protein